MDDVIYHIEPKDSPLVAMTRDRDPRLVSPFIHDWATAGKIIPYTEQGWSDLLRWRRSQGVG